MTWLESSFKHETFEFKIHFQNTDKDSGQEFGLWAQEIVHEIKF